MTSRRATKSQEKRKIAVVVMGMHRSGTSLLASILDRLGCQGPKTPLPPSQWNPKGYFESSELVKLNDEILAALGSGWDDWSAASTGWHDSPRFLEFRERIAEGLNSEYGKASLIYLKDPRLCRLFPLWNDALSDLGFSPVCIHTHRNPVDIARSLEARNGNPVEPQQAMLLWMRHVLDAEMASRGLPRIFISYDRMLESWSEVADRAESAFGFPWPVLRRSRESRISGIVDPSLRHNASSVESFLRNPDISPLLKDCLRIMEHWAIEGEDAAGRETLMQIAQTFDASADLFAVPLMEVTRKYRDARDLRLQAKVVQEDLAASVSELNAVRKERAVLGEENADLQERITAAQEELRIANERLTQLRAEADLRASELEEQLTAALSRADDSDAQLASVRHQHTDLLDSQNRLIADISELRMQSVAHRGEADGKIQSLETELTSLTESLIERDRLSIRLQKEFAARNLQLEQDRVEVIARLHQEYRSSTSWRFSAPLRAIGRLLKSRG